jgi:hypothetical protein
VISQVTDLAKGPSDIDALELSGSDGLSECSRIVLFCNLQLVLGQQSTFARDVNVIGNIGRWQTGQAPLVRDPCLLFVSLLPRHKLPFGRRLGTWLSRVLGHDECVVVDRRLLRKRGMVRRKKTGVGRGWPNEG